MRRGHRWCALLILLATLAACHDAPTPTTTRLGPPIEYRRARAREALARWDAAASRVPGRGLVPTTPTLRTVGDWEPALAVAGPAMIASGNFWPAPEADAYGVNPHLTHVRWADGTTRGVEVVPVNEAAQDVRDIQPRSAPCPAECAALHVGRPTMVTGTVDTASGTATAPFWSFPLTGSRVRVERLAVRMPIGVTVPTVMTYNVVRLDGVQIGPDGRTLTLTLIGGPASAAVACGHDYVAEVVESAHAVVPIVTDIGHRDNPQPCDAGGHFRTVTVVLAAPLGDRTVLQEKTGQPLPTNFS